MAEGGEMMNRNVLFRWMNRLVDGLLWGAACVVVWILLQVFVFASYYVPSNSMMPTLQPGDYVWVDKLAYGARLFSLTKAAGGKPFGMSRAWGYGKVKRNDVVVFNHPYPENWKEMEFDLMKYYVKRCVALPGDSFEIRRGHYRVRGSDEALGNVPEQELVYQVSMYGERKIEGLNLHAFPKWRLFGWTIMEFGPMYVPRRGDTLPMTRKHYWLYHKLIEWETRKALRLDADGTVWLDDRQLEQYTFRHGYYFMAGDHVADSNDSRYWGLVPDDFIAGKVAGIWKSKDPLTGKIRWKRIGMIN